MDTEQLQALSQLIGLLNDSSLAKGLGDCLQITARLAARNLSALEPPKTPNISRDQQQNPNPVTPIQQANREPGPADLDEDDLRFLSVAYRSTGEVAQYIEKSKTFVRDLIDEGKLDSRKNPKNGYNEVSTTSVRKWMNGEASEETRSIRSST